jgi:hypothetical protein
MFDWPGDDPITFSAVGNEVGARVLEAAIKVRVLPLGRIAVALWEWEIGPVASVLIGVVHDTLRESGCACADDVIALAEDCENPVLKALAAEAGWRLRCGVEPYRLAASAIQTYRVLAAEPRWLLSDQAEFLTRAFALGLDLNDSRTARQIADDLIAVLRRAVANAPDHDSHALGRLDFQQVFDDGLEADQARAEQQFHDAGLFALRVFARHRNAAILKDVPWDEIERCAVAAFEEAGSDRSLRAALLEPVAAIIDDPIARRSIVKTNLQAEVAWARTQVAGTHYVVLVQAERTAREIGLPDVAAELQREIQGLDPAAILTPVRTEVAIDGSTVDALVSRFVAQVFVGDDWREWARNLVVVAGCPLPDSTAELRDGYVAARPIAASLPSLTTGAKNVPVRSESDGASLADQASQGHVQLFASMLLVPAVAEFLRRIDDVDGADLTAFFVSKGLDDVRAGHIIGGLRLHRAGDVDGAAHKLLPRIEYLLREYASSRTSVIRPTDGTLRGGVDLLGAVLAGLDGHTDASWRRYLQFVLVDDHGLNLRNDTLHGIRPEVNERDAAIVLHALLVACFLDDLRVPAAHTSEAPPGSM